MLRFNANLSTMFQEVGFIDRFHAAAEAGFRGVEFLFPYAWPKSQLQDELGRLGLTPVLFNLPPGDWERGERGIACHPDRIGEFQQSVGLAIEYAQALGCKQLHCMSGIVPATAKPEVSSKTLVDNLRFAADALAATGFDLLIEPINLRDMPGYYLHRSAQAIELIATVDRANLGLQYDVYHMQIMEGDLAPTIARHFATIRHVQIADTPGRHEPGTGEINYPFLFDHLDRLGYQGWIGCEYRPVANTVAGLEWLRRYRNARASCA